MRDFEAQVEQLRADWAGSSEADVLDAAIGAEIADFTTHRASIEQAKGVLMQLLSVDADAAFAVLARYSQVHNVKLRVLAERLAQAATQQQTPIRNHAGLDALMGRLAADPEQDGPS
jgi:AmiR/NasT family two-component response regulator